MTDKIDELKYVQGVGQTVLYLWCRLKDTPLRFAIKRQEVKCSSVFSSTGFLMFIYGGGA